METVINEKQIQEVLEYIQRKKALQDQIKESTAALAEQKETGETIATIQKDFDISTSNIEGVKHILEDLEKSLNGDMKDIFVNTFNSAIGATLEESAEASKKIGAAAYGFINYLESFFPLNPKNRIKLENGERISATVNLHGVNTSYDFCRILEKRIRDILRISTPSKML